MKINIENMVNQACTCISKDTGAYKYGLKELVSNLQLLKVEHENGKSKEALDEFFKLYVFNRK